MKKIWILLLLPIVLLSCDEINKAIEDLNKPLTEEQIIDGLKTALTVGVKESVISLSATDGYYGNAAIKLMLPPEADVLIDNINNPIFKTLGIDTYLNNQIGEVIKRMNRAAEAAAPEAKEIFISAITNMTVSDAVAILQGKYENTSAVLDSTSATKYLKKYTYTQLVALFAPSIKVALDKPLISGISTNTAWNGLTGAYNRGAILIGSAKIETNLETYATQKALDGLFYKVGNIEKDIRRDPLAWAKKTAKDILDLVFGSVH